MAFLVHRAKAIDSFFNNGVICLRILAIRITFAEGSYRKSNVRRMARCVRQVFTEALSEDKDFGGTRLLGKK